MENNEATTSKNSFLFFVGLILAINVVFFGSIIFLTANTDILTLVIILLMALGLVSFGVLCSPFKLEKWMLFAFLNTVAVMFFGILLYYVTVNVKIKFDFIFVFPFVMCVFAALIFGVSSYRSSLLPFKVFFLFWLAYIIVVVFSLIFSINALFVFSKAMLSVFSLLTFMKIVNYLVYIKYTFVNMFISATTVFVGISVYFLIYIFLY